MIGGETAGEKNKKVFLTMMTCLLTHTHTHTHTLSLSLSLSLFLFLPLLHFPTHLMHVCSQTLKICLLAVKTGLRAVHGLALMDTATSAVYEVPVPDVFVHRTPPQ